MRRAALLLFLVPLACSGRTTPLESLRNTGAADAGFPDSGTADAGVVDAGSTVLVDAGAGRCDGLDEQTCNDRRCRWDTCNGCYGQVLFGECHDYGESPIACPAIACPDCFDLGEEACLDHPDCHAVYNADAVPVCDCNTPGCCIFFERCSEGPAICEAPPEILCDRIPPECDGPYVIGYRGGCYEGCARIEECRAP